MSTGADAAAYAMRFIGTPYIYGGNKPGGFDCSGLIQYVYGKLGINLPRTSEEQATFGQTVPNSQIMPGDLLFYNTTGTNSHVAMYAGNGMQIVARHTGLPVMLQKVGNFTHAQRVTTPGSGVGGVAGMTPVGNQVGFGIPTPQDFFGAILQSIGVPDMKDLFERLGLILLGTGLVFLGLNVMGRNAIKDILGSDSSSGGEAKESEPKPETKVQKQVQEQKGESDAA